MKTILAIREESTRSVHSLLRPGDPVRIEFDVEKRDRYGRLLGYVYLSDGRMLNEEIVRSGLANLLTHPPNVKYQERFLKADREARENNGGDGRSENEEKNEKNDDIDGCWSSRPHWMPELHFLRAKIYKRYSIS